MKRILLLLFCLIFILESTGQQCNQEYITNRSISNFSGSTSSYSGGTLPGWHPYSGYPKVSSTNASTTANSHSIFLREVDRFNSANGTFNNLQAPINKGDYILEFKVYTTSIQREGELEIILIDGADFISENTTYNASPSSLANNFVTSPKKGVRIKTLNESDLGAPSQWNTIQIPFSITTTNVDYYQLLFLPKENQTSSSGMFQIRLDDVSIKAAPFTANTTIINHQICNSPCSGRVEVFANGGKLPYRYELKLPSGQTQIGPINTTASNGGLKSALSGLCAGTYTLTVLDANYCSHTIPITITSKNCKVNNYTYLDDYYSGGQTFSGKFYADKDIHLWDGIYTLAAGSHLEMMTCAYQYDSDGKIDPNGYRKIYLHKDAKLIIDNSTVTGYCNNVWYGIVLKDFTAELEIINQGSVGHAYRGVSGEGHYVSIYNANFINNLNGVSNLVVNGGEIGNSTFSSSPYLLPEPYNTGDYVMDHGIQFQGNLKSDVFHNKIDNVIHGIEVLTKAAGNFAVVYNNDLTNVRKYGISLYNSSLFYTGLAHSNTIELNANYFAPTGNSSEVIGIYQNFSSVSPLFASSVTYNLNKITRSTGSLGKNLIGISDITYTNGTSLFIGDNDIDLERTQFGHTIGIKSQRNQLNGLLQLRRNIISNLNNGILLGNGATYNAIEYSTYCNKLSHLDTGIETIPYLSSGLSTDVSQIIIGSQNIPAATVWNSIGANQKLKNNSIYKLHYWKASNEAMSTSDCYNYSPVNYQLNIGPSTTCN